MLFTARLRVVLVERMAGVAMGNGRGTSFWWSAWRPHLGYLSVWCAFFVSSFVSICFKEGGAIFERVLLGLVVCRWVLFGAGWSCGLTGFVGCCGFCVVLCLVFG